MTAERKFGALPHAVDLHVRMQRRPSRGLAKFIRREKARLRRMHPNFADAQAKIHALVRQFWSTQQHRP